MCDSELQALYNELKAVTGQLDRINTEPAASSVLNILAYSKSLQEKQAR
jgi:hypothetical protein